MVENTPESPVLSVGAIDGSGPESYEWRIAMRPLVARIRRLREGVSSPLCVNVVYFIPGPTVQIDFEGVRTGSFSRAKRDLIVQAALPEQPAVPYDEILRSLMVASIDAAEAFAKRRKIADSLPELRDLVGRL